MYTQQQSIKLTKSKYSHQKGATMFDFFTNPTELALGMMVVAIGLIIFTCVTGKNDQLYTNGGYISVSQYCGISIIAAIIFIGVMVAISSFFGFLNGPVGSMVVAIVFALFIIGYMIALAIKHTTEAALFGYSIPVIVVQCLKAIVWTGWVIFNIAQPWPYNALGTIALTVTTACAVAMADTIDTMFKSLRPNDLDLEPFRIVSFYFYGFGVVYGLGNLPTVISTIINNGINNTVLIYIYGLIIPIILNIVVIILRRHSRNEALA